MGAFSSLSNCCNLSETSGNIKKENEENEKENVDNEKVQKDSENNNCNGNTNNIPIINNINNNNINKLVGYNTSQKILELKEYRFYINNLYGLMMTNDSLAIKEFYFIKKSWIKSWYKYTCYEEIRPLLLKYEINNELDFHDIIIKHKKKLNFEGFIEKTKPEAIQFFEINNLNTNVKENFYIFDSNILKKFIEIYDISDNYNNKKEFSLKGEIGKGRIVFDVQEYILIMILNVNWEIKQIMVIFGNPADHKQFVKNISGRALTYISKELKKKVQQKKMVNYQKDEIYVYDDREFVKYEFLNNSQNFKKKSKNKKEKEIEKEGNESLKKESEKKENESEKKENQVEKKENDSEKKENVREKKENEKKEEREKKENEKKEESEKIEENEKKENEKIDENENNENEKSLEMKENIEGDKNTNENNILDENK